LSSQGHFEVIQIEVSSRCISKCVMCPMTTFQEKWIAADMRPSTYEKISRHMENAKMVWLQGWGESLLSENIFNMVKVAVKSAAKVGLTTNGMMLTEKASKKLVEEGINVLAISMAGSKKETHDSIRIGTSFDKMIENVRRAVSLKRSLGISNPRMVFTFLRMKHNIHELPEVVELAGKLGVDEVVGTNLDYVACKSHEEMKVFSEEPISRKCEKILIESEKAAKESGVTLHNYPLQMHDTAICFENPLKNICISHDGTVSPCVYLNLPIKSLMIPRVFKEKKYQVPKFIMGDVNNEDLENIWFKPKYVEFRSAYEERVKVFGLAENPIYALLQFEVGKDVPSLPEPCRTCYKAYGV